MACLCASNQAVLYVMPSWASSWTVATVAERAQSLQRTAPWWRAKVQCNDRRRFTEGVQARNLLFGISFCSAQLASPAMVRLLLDHGADPHHSDTEDKSPADYVARDGGDRSTSIRDLLK
jgi:hypothetical protein